MKHSIGVDLGGSKIEAALVDETGNRHKKIRMKTPSKPSAIVNTVEKVIDKVKDKEILGIGLGTPGFIHDNQVESSPNVEGVNKALKKLKRKFPNLVIENDANCFALAEYKWGAGRDCENMIGVIWGTGIGGGIITESELLRGSIGGAGEIGQMIICKNEEGFEPGGKGTWEYYCSGPNIVRRYKENGGDLENPQPDDILESDEDIASEVIEKVLSDMGVGLGNLVNIFNPEKIVMGGGVSNLPVYHDLNEQMRKHSLELSGQSCKVVENELGDSSGVLGAAALVF